jgi:hypothetical protein
LGGKLFTSDAEENQCNSNRLARVRCGHKCAGQPLIKGPSKVIVLEIMASGEKMCPFISIVWGRVSLPQYPSPSINVFFFFCMYQLIHTTNIYLSTTHTYSSSYFIKQAIANI